MIFNMNGGGGAALNFKVVGGTSTPSSPTENTIWVNTSTAITSWVFSATQPTATSGRVWIKTTAASSADFNALKNNTLQVYPAIAKQYVSGAWVNKNAKIYKNGTWVSFDPEGALFYQGSECVHITGGWEIIPNYKPGQWHDGGYPTGIKTITSDGYLRVERDKSTNSEIYGKIMLRTKNKIDLSNYSTLTCKHYTAYTANSNMNVGVCSGTEYLDQFPAIWTSSNPCNMSDETVTVNISSLSGSYYVTILVGYWGFDENAYAQTNEIILS